MIRHSRLRLLVLTTAALLTAPRVCLAVEANPLGISFKRDPRLIDPTHGGNPWVAPLTYQGIDAQDTVEARANLIDVTGRIINVEAKWIVSDPEMVQVSPRTGREVKIRVKRPGQSRVTVVAGGRSRILDVTARYHGRWMQLAITQLGGPTFIPPPPQPPVAERKPDDGSTLPGGLRYEVVKMGDGPTPTERDVVECSYQALAPNGQVLDSSYARGGPVKVSVSETRWKDALTMMPVGSIWRITVPGHQLPASDRPQGRRHHRPRFSPPVMVEVELLSISEGAATLDPLPPRPGEVRL